LGIVNVAKVLGEKPGGFMKKWLGAATLLVLGSLALGGQVNAAVIKPGASCAKVGITAVSQGKKYTCVKSGSKRVWSRGVKVTVKPTPTPTPTPTPSQTAPKITLDSLDPN